MMNEPSPLLVPDMPPPRRSLPTIIVGVIVGLLPFSVSMATWSARVDGGIAHVMYRDWVAITCGVAAGLFGSIGIWQQRRVAARAVPAGLVVALAGWQLARGFGLFFHAPDARDEVHESAQATESVRTPDAGICGDGADCLAIGSDRQQAGDEAGALSAYERACTAGNAKGCFEAGSLLRGGSKPDPAAAIRMLERACELARPIGCSDAGIQYERGEGVAVDVSHARQLFEKACDAGDGVGCNNLAVVFANGEGTPVDAKRALTLYARGCDLGAADSCDGEGAMLFKGEGGKRDVRRAIALFTEACDADPEHCFNLGVAVSSGAGVAKDLPRARVLYDTACSADNYLACNNLGDLLRKGLGGPKDLAQANLLFEKACKNGVEGSCDAIAARN